MNALENFMNRLTDMNWGWWPFLFLRPEKEEIMTLKYLAKISLYYGLLYGILLGIYAYYITHNKISFLFPVAFILFFFVGFSSTFAIFWNRRSRRLQESKQD